MAYTVILKRSAEKELACLPETLHRRIATKLLELENNPRPPGIQKLHGHDGYRIRIGDYRVLYLIDDQRETIQVTAIGHRREVYR
ncbi:MAG: type II toxin-antitoxin system RelE/ParE family toxin [Verrucomicrobia bacterium]|nr:type II toxin-antitoxin system RelE/ParE family toxin [Verrucomicrobiota bacterium]